MTTNQLLILFFVSSGAFIIFLSALGIYRLPDVFCRSHALAKSMPLGINLMLIGAWIHLGTDLIGFKTFLAILFQVLTIPVAGHLVGLLAFEKNIPRHKQSEVIEHNS